MTLLVVTPGRDSGPLVKAIHAQDPTLPVRVWPDVGPADDIRFAVLWQQPRGLLAQLPDLLAVSSLGAGVEHVLNDPDLPPELPVGRLAGTQLAADMAAYVVAQVLWHWRRLGDFGQLQRQGQWQPWAPERAPHVGLLGIGAMGTATSRALQALEIPVRAFGQTGRGPDSVPVESGADGLARLAGWSDYLVCLLPLTGATRGLLNADLFSRMRPGSVLINVGRGEHLVEADLLEALDQDRPTAAILDVFSHEPLPSDHPFWTHPKVHVTPHCASITGDREAAALIVESYRRVLDGHPPLGLVDRPKGY